MHISSSNYVYKINGNVISFPPDMYRDMLLLSYSVQYEYLCAIKLLCK